MTFEQFRKWANQRACDGQWDISHIIRTREIYAKMIKVKFFKRKYWKKHCEKLAIELVEDVNWWKKERKNEQRTD